MRRVGLALVTLLSLPAAAVPPLPPPPPPLIIVIDVDESTGSLFDRYRSSFFEAIDRAGLYYAVALSGSDSSGEPRRAPILLWRAGMVPTERLEAVSTRDVAPTLAAMLGLSALRASRGRCLPTHDVTCPKE